MKQEKHFQERTNYLKFITLFRLDDGLLRFVTNREVTHLYETNKIFEYKYKKVEIIGHSFDDYSELKEVLDTIHQYKVGNALYATNQPLIDYFERPELEEAKDLINKKYIELKYSNELDREDLEYKAMTLFRANTLDIEYKPDEFYEWLYEQYEKYDKKIFKAAFRFQPNASFETEREGMALRDILDREYRHLQFDIDLKRYKEEQENKKKQEKIKEDKRKEKLKEVGYQNNIHPDTGLPRCNILEQNNYEYRNDSLLEVSGLFDEFLEKYDE